MFAFVCHKLEENFGDRADKLKNTKWIIRSCRSKDRRVGQKKKDKKTNNDSLNRKPDCAT